MLGGFGMALGKAIRRQMCHEGTRWPRIVSFSPTSTQVPRWHAGHREGFPALQGPAAPAGEAEPGSGVVLPLPWWPAARPQFVHCTLWAAPVGPWRPQRSGQEGRRPISLCSLWGRDGAAGAVREWQVSSRWGQVWKEIKSRGGAQWGRGWRADLDTIVPEGFSKEVSFEKSPNGDARTSHVTRREEGALYKRLGVQGLRLWGACYFPRSRKRPVRLKGLEGAGVGQAGPVTMM